MIDNDVIVEHLRQAQFVRILMIYSVMSREGGLGLEVSDVFVRHLRYGIFGNSIYGLDS